MEPHIAKIFVEAWQIKVAGRQPTKQEAAIIWRYRAFAEGRDPNELEYDPAQMLDDDDDL